MTLIQLRKETLFNKFRGINLLNGKRVTFSVKVKNNKYHQQNKSTDRFSIQVFFVDHIFISHTELTLIKCKKFILYSAVITHISILGPLKWLEYHPVSPCHPKECVHDPMNGAA